MEVHAELKTRTKMFCKSANDPHGTEANTHICPVCLAHPGTLPVINKEAVRHVLHVGLALGAELATYTEFDRKNYFYPDIPKGYQISQYAYPLVRGGSLAGVAITRVHLEEDTARSLHDQGEGSVVDFNRAGVPLMELVTEPVIHDAKTAAHFARELQLLLKTLDVSDANMEKGEMRAEANISISKTDELGTKVEVKNLNSFKAVEKAIEFEIKRQTKVLDSGEQVVQETRGWDENRDKTFSQRSKETSEEYRYFPDPDLPSLDLKEEPEFQVSRLKETMNETPDFKRQKYTNLGLTSNQTELIVTNLDTSRFFEQLIPALEGRAELLKNSVNYLTSDVQALLTPEQGLASAHTDQFVSLMTMVTDNKITSRVAKDLLPEALFSGIDPEQTAKERNLIQDNNEDSLAPIVEQVIEENPSVVEDYRSGKEASLQYLVGQGMKISKGSANPKMLSELLQKKIGSNNA
jgi:aspartyl-tRNA(Asn)/glutamyl-tRNA(Gln) amidotransferase subunit B